MIVPSTPPYRISFPRFEEYQEIRVFPMMANIAWLGSGLGLLAVVFDLLLLPPENLLTLYHAVAALLAALVAGLARFHGPLRLRLGLMLVLINLVQVCLMAGTLLVERASAPVPGLLVFYFFSILPLASLLSLPLLVLIDGLLVIEVVLLVLVAQGVGAVGPQGLLDILRFLIPGQIFLSLMTVWTRKQAIEVYLLARDDHVHLSLDGLSQVLNRSTWLHRSEDRLGRNRDKGVPSSLIMADIDHFKKVNDTQGHPAGDKVIQAVAKVLVDSTRDADLVGRLGGEEFALFLPDCPLATAVQVADRIRAGVEALVFPWGAGVTISLGVVEDPGPSVDWDGLVQEGDRRLYAAKAQGRNRVVAEPGV